jgi:hypothetical protein
MDDLGITTRGVLSDSALLFDQHDAITGTSKLRSTGKANDARTDNQAIDIH